MISSPPILCKNCGAEISGKFCSSCGQKVYNEKDKTVKAILHEVMHFMTHFEGTLITSIRTIYTKPGQYALDYCNGIRKRYFKPVSLFLVLVILYLFFPLLKGLNLNMQGFMADDGKSTVFERLIEHKMQVRHLNLEQISAKYAAKSEKISKILLLILIPLSAWLLYLLFIRSKKFAFDFFILATELNIFFLLSFYLIFPFLLYFIDLFLPDPIEWHSETFLVVFVMIAFSIYCFISFKKFFAQNNLKTTLKAVLFPIIHLLIILTIYRYLLFGASMMMI